MRKRIVTILIVLFSICLCLSFVTASVFGGWFLFQKSANPKSILVPSNTATSPQEIVQTPNGKAIMPTPNEPSNTQLPNGQSNTQTPTAQTNEPPADQGAVETLNTLKNTIVPPNDYRVLAERFKGVHNVPETLPNPPKNYHIGDAESFWISKDDTHENFQVKAILRYAGDHLYFWVDEQSHYDQPSLDKLAKAFDEKIYPTDRAFFGSEWSPGIDNDNHLYILYAHGVGNRVAGYFSARDEIPPLANPYSNGHEMFVINADQAQLNNGFTYGVLAHEFQHMIHWNRDRNDAVWMNEGFSQLATLLNGYYGGGFDNSFINNPDLQLNDWPNDPNATVAHYGAGFLFLDYFLNRFGEVPTQALVGEKANGLDKVDKVLQENGINDKQTGSLIKADDVFADWAVTNYLLNPDVGDGRYQYQNYQTAPKANATTIIKDCPSKFSETVHQYGTDYIDVTCQGKFNFNFQGNSQTKMLPVEAHSGKYAFWSNKGDDSDMTLTRSFDLSNIKGDAILDYWTWYDLETDFDYAYLEVSQDGQNWTILKTPNGTDKNPSGESYGWGYNDTSKQWKEEKINLNAYRGSKIQIRFEYITDDAVNGEGLLLDDINLPALNYSSDFETGDGGWDAQGFVRVQNILPQTYIVSLIKEGMGKTSIERVTLNSEQSASIPIDLGDEFQHVTAVVSGSARFTRTAAPYTITITP